MKLVYVFELYICKYLTGLKLVRWLQVIRKVGVLYPDPTLVLLLAVFGRLVQEPFRPMGRKGLVSEVMTMLGMRPSVPRITCPSAKSPLCHAGKYIYYLISSFCSSFQFQLIKIRRLYEQYFYRNPCWVLFKSFLSALHSHLGCCCVH